MTVCVTVVLCNEYRQHKTHTQWRTTVPILCISRHISAYLGMSDFFPISDLDWLIYLFVFFSRSLLVPFIRFLHFVSLVRRLCCCHSFVLLFAHTHTLQRWCFDFLFLQWAFFGCCCRCSVCVCVCARTRQNFRFMDEPNEWMCRILFMSQLSIRWIFSRLCVNGSSASNRIHLHCCIT